MCIVTNYGLWPTVTLHFEVEAYIKFKYVFYNNSLSLQTITINYIFKDMIEIS